tara:strand:+ start:132 stop:494 length:363 start_codon:yes stop_codon:yes gene_type:complete
MQLTRIDIENMQLSKSQSAMLLRASGIDEMIYGQSLRNRDSLRILQSDYYRENLSTHSICDVYGSGEHRTANALQKKGIGRMFTSSPCDCYFFKIYKDDAERIADDESRRLFFESLNARN